MARYIVRGILAGFDMPIMGTCHRGLKLNLTGAMSVSYDDEGFLPKNNSVLVDLPLK